jgi:hypothetical protein
MHKRRAGRAIIAAIVFGVVVMGLCNGADILLTFHPLVWSPDVPGPTSFSLAVELNMLPVVLGFGVLAALVGYLSTYNRPD